jgi:hypothetical protein
MKNIGISATALIFALLSEFTFAADSSHVAVDASKPHVTTFIGISKTLPEADFQKFKEGLAQVNGAYMVTWEEFKSDPAKHVRPRILRNDYAEIDVINGLVSLIERYDRAPFGLTWNGGLALTGNDYQYTARSHKSFSNDPNSFSREADRRKDPVHPQNHLEPLLRR